MKILHLVNTYAPAGGVETYVLKLLPLLRAAGHENALIYRETHPRTPDHEGQPIYHVPQTDDAAADRRRVSQIVARERPSALYLHDVYDPHLIQDVATLAPAVGYVHIFYPVCPGLGKLFHRGDRVCERPYGPGCIPMIYLRRCASARHPASVLRIMQNTGRYLAAYRTLPQILVGSRYMKGLMAQNGIDDERVNILPPHFIDDLPDTSAGPHRHLFFAGRLEYEKGLPYLLRAMQFVSPPHQLLVAGDGSRKAEYEEMAQELGVADRVRFLGWLSAEELARHYRQCLVFIMPTLMPEPFGKSGVEALAHGRPVVAFNVGGIPDWLRDGEHGYLAPPRSVEVLAMRINKLLSDPELATQLGENGRCFVADTYAAEKHVAQLVETFKTTIYG